MFLLFETESAVALRLRAEGIAVIGFVSCISVNSEGLVSAGLWSLQQAYSGHSKAGQSSVCPSIQQRNLSHVLCRNRLLLYHRAILPFGHLHQKNCAVREQSGGVERAYSQQNMEIQKHTRL